MIRALALCLLIPISATAAEITRAQVDFGGARFSVVRVDPASVSLVWKDASGTPYRSFDRVQAAFAKQGKTLRFITNAGIFEEGGIPSGLHIQDGESLLPLNDREAPGNFFLQPNGVCAFDGRTPLIVTRALWRAKDPATFHWAIQSGPLLLIDGQRHPQFRKDSSSRLHRSGVGITRDRQLVFAITAPGQSTNFWDFAGLFLHLGCRDALFLDGTISAMEVNPSAPLHSLPFAAMFVVAE